MSDRIPKPRLTLKDKTRIIDRLTKELIGIAADGTDDMSDLEKRLLKELTIEAEKPEVLWVRCGDSDSYNKFDDLNEAAEYLKEAGVTDKLHQCMGGMTAPGFTSANYISIYWGEDPKEPTMSRQLMKREFLDLRMVMR